MRRSMRTVAIVEDDPSMRRSLQRLLGAYGFQPLEFSSAEAFLNRGSEGGVDCLVLDVELGGMSGIDLMRKLNEVGSTLPVIVITALESTSVRAQVERLGCIAFLRKPFDAALLIAAINAALTQ